MNEKDYISQTEANGNINISEEVIASIAAAAAKEVEGVSGMSAGFSAEFAEKLGKKSTSKGVKIETAEDGISVNLSILIKYGSDLRRVAEEVQEAAFDAVGSMTGLAVKTVNVNVVGVSFDKGKE